MVFLDVAFFLSCVLLLKDLCQFKSFFDFLTEMFFALECSFLFFEVCVVRFLFPFEDFTVENYEVESLLNFRISAGRACLMFVVIPTLYNVDIAMVETGSECQSTDYMSSQCKNCCGGWLGGSVVPAKFLRVFLDKLSVVDETSNALAVVWFGNGARCVSRDVTLHRLSAYS